jgi:hypothetical protein
LFRRLADAYPATLPVDELAGPGQDGERVRRALLNLLQEGRAGISVLPVAVGRGTEERPIAWAGARAEAALGLPYVTNLHHVTVAVSKVAAALTARMDGTLTREALVAWLAAELAGGRVLVPEADRVALQASGETAATLAGRQLSETLRHLAASAVLEATAAGA